MKVAVTFDRTTGCVFQHFGHTEFFKLYEIEDGKIIKSEVVDNGGFGHHDLPGYLKNLGVQVLILGNRGQGAIDAINRAGLKQYAGVTGDADEAARSFAAGTLVHNEEAICSHKHGHQHKEELKFVPLK